MNGQPNGLDAHNAIDAQANAAAIADVHVSQQQLRWRSILLIPLVIAFGLGCKMYGGPGFDLINNFGPASVAYVVLIMLLLFAAMPNPRRIASIAITAFVMTSVVEILQLWHPAWLTAIRQTLLGRLVLGTTFNMLDFPAYVVGSIVGFVILNFISRSRPLPISAVKHIG